MASADRAVVKSMASVGRASRMASVMVGVLGMAALLLASCGMSTTQQRTTAPARVPASVYVTSVNPANTPSDTEKVTVAALDAGSGAVRWRYTAQSMGFDRPSSPVVADGRVYVTSDDNVPHSSPTNPATGTLTALRATDGARIWQAQIGPMASRPVVAGDAVYVSAKHIGQSMMTTRVYALDPVTGKERWHTTLGADVAGVSDSLVLAGGTLYISSNQVCFDVCNAAFLVALRASDGVLLWHTSIAGNINIPPPLVQDGRLYTLVREYSDGAAQTQVALLAYGAADGRPLWKYLTHTQDSNGADQYLAPLAANGQVYAVTADVLNPSNPGAAHFSVTALDGATAAVQWTTPIPAEAQLVTLGDGTLYAESAKGTVLTALAADTGRERWHVALPAPLVTVAPSAGELFGEGLILGSHTWKRVLFALRPGDGHLLWTVPFGAPETSVLGPYVPPIAVVAGDTVYVAYGGGTTVAAVAAASGHINCQFATDGVPVGVTAAP